MTARLLIASLISTLVIQTGFLSPVFGKPPAPTAEVAVEVRLIRISWPALVQLTDKKMGNSICRKALVGCSNPGGFLLNDIDVFQFFEILEGHRSTNHMQVPKIVVPDGRSGTCQITDTHSFVTDVVRIKSTQGQLMDIPKNEAFETGLRVFIRPKVPKDDQVVRLHLKVKDKSLDGPVPLFPVTTMITPIYEGGAQGVPVPFTQYLQQPSFTTHILDKRLSVPDGGTILLGGWTRTDVRTEESGVPIAEDLPLIGGLFKKTTQVREVAHVYLMVTPHVLVPKQEEHTAAKATCPRSKAQADKQAAAPAPQAAPELPR